MEKLMNDSEFELYSKIQRFFYRCYSMYGLGQDGTNRTLNSDTARTHMEHWGNKLFKDDYSVWPYNIEVVEDGVLRLILESNRVLGGIVVTVNLNTPITNSDLFNIKWIYFNEQPINTNDNCVWKKVPKVFQV